MKRQLLSLTLFCCLLGCPVFAQWSSHAPVLSQKQGIYDLRMAPDNHQAAWSICNKYNVQSTAFTQSSTNNQLMIARTADGGDTWNGVESPVAAGILASNISPVSDSIAWISFINFDGTLHSSVYRTNDGGTTWVQQLQDGFLPPAGYVDMVYFWDDQTGIAMGDPNTDPSGLNSFFEIWRTSDGGQSWARVPESQIPAALPVEYGWSGHSSYDAIGQTIWFETVDGTNFPNVQGSRIFRSKDAGENWEAFDFPGLYGISFADTLHGIALQGNPWVGEGQVVTPVYRTTDGGETWQQSGEINGKLTTSVELVPGSLSLIASIREDNFGPYTTQISHDWGQTWIELGTTDEFVAALTFSNPTLGYAGDWQRVSSKPFNVYGYTGDPISGILSGKPLEAAMEVFPNPASGFVSIQAKTPQSADFLLLVNDAQGRLVERQVFEKTAEVSYLIDMRGLPAGVYSLTLSTQNGVLSKQIVKQ